MDWRRAIARSEPKKPVDPPGPASPANPEALKPGGWGNVVESGVHLPGLTIAFLRTTELAVPHEVSVIIPRAEIRYSWWEAGRQRQAEVILNSITLVDAPRHPTAVEQPPAAGPTGGPARPGTEGRPAAAERATEPPHLTTFAAAARHPPAGSRRPDPCSR